MLPPKLQRGGGVDCRSHIYNRESLNDDQLGNFIDDVINRKVDVPEMHVYLEVYRHKDLDDHKFMILDASSGEMSRACYDITFDYEPYYFGSSDVTPDGIIYDCDDQATHIANALCLQIANEHSIIEILGFRGAMLKVNKMLKSAGKEAHDPLDLGNMFGNMFGNN